MINRFRNNVINFRVTEEQKEQIIYKMKKSKIDNFNDFSHKCIFTNKLYIIDFKTIDEVIKYLASIENNISQLINISEKNKNQKQTIILKLQKTKIKNIKREYFNIKKELQNMSNFRNANKNFRIIFTDFEYEYFQNLKQKSKIKK